PFLNHKILVGERWNEHGENFLDRATTAEIGMHIILLPENVHEVEYPGIERLQESSIVRDQCRHFLVSSHFESLVPDNNRSFVRKFCPQRTENFRHGIL